jgi:uncharacterized protein
MNPDHFKKAKEDAEKGDKEAQRHLGFLYFLGEDVPQDYVEAYKWLTLCGQEAAKAVIQQIVRNMKVDEITEAQKRIVQFRSRQ